MNHSLSRAGARPLEAEELAPLSGLFQEERGAPPAVAAQAPVLAEELAEPCELAGSASLLGPDPWSRLAAAVGIHPQERLLLALSGGADSIFLLHAIASSARRPPLLAVHVDHGLRGRESELDAEFCAQVCQSTRVPLRTCRLELDPRPAGLEARARRARYEALVEEARRSGHRTILTAHHADDALETLLLRWVRGTPSAGLAGLRARRGFRRAPGITLVRPLLGLRREDLRAYLARHHLAWREDASNSDRSFARNRVRHEVLPAIERAAGGNALENLFQFAHAVEALESALGDATAHLSWSLPRFPAALPTAGPAASEDASRAGETSRTRVLARAALHALSTPLRRRALVRLLSEGTGRAPGRAVLAAVLDDLATARCSQHALPGGWTLLLRARTLELEAPRALAEASLAKPSSDAPPSERGPSLPFPEIPAPESASALRLPVPGSVALPEGRLLLAELLHRPAGRAVPREAFEVELDAETLGLAGDCLPAGGRPASSLLVRAARPGDRFHPLGAPGSKPLRRFLADAGVPRAERGRVPLVCLGEQVIWVAGVRPCEPARVRPTTRWRLRLSLTAG